MPSDEAAPEWFGLPPATAVLPNGVAYRSARRLSPRTPGGP